MPPFTTVKHHFINNPTIAAFEWNPDTTPLSSPQSLIITVTTYLSLTFLLLRIPLPPLPAALLRVISALHNLCILSVSDVAVITGLENKRDVFCFPVGTVKKGPVFFWAYVFYLSKILEFVDTLLIILSGGYNVLHLIGDGSITISCGAGDECNSAYSHVFVLFAFRNRNPAEVEEGSNGLSDCAVRLQLPSVRCDAVVSLWLRGRVFWFQGLVLQRIFVVFVLGFPFKELQDGEGAETHEEEG